MDGGESVLRATEIDSMIGLHEWPAHSTCGGVPKITVLTEHHSLRRAVNDSRYGLLAARGAEE
jgi:hypothetical protein